MKSSLILAITVCVVATATSLAGQDTQRKVGYTDTPFVFPGSKYRVHDGTRKQPRVVTPAPVTSAVQPAPSDAIILFDGKDMSKWTNAKWKAVDGAFMCRAEGEPVKSVGDTFTKDSFEDYQLHVEWSTPTPHGEIDQARGNSGVFLSGKYEIQVLDSYENITYPDGQAGSVYGQQPPLVNASRKPGEWQTYDIYYTSPRFSADGKLTDNGYVTLVHNGVLVQNHHKILGDTRHRTAPAYSAHGPAPIKLQDHSNATKFRNIWIRPIKEDS